MATLTALDEADTVVDGLDHEVFDGFSHWSNASAARLSMGRSRFRMMNRHTMQLVAVADVAEQDVVDGLPRWSRDPYLGFRR